VRGLRAHRLLLVVYGSAALLAFFELHHSYALFGSDDRPEWYLDPDHNIVDVSAAIHPGRAATLFYRAFQASLCQDASASTHEVCRARGPVGRDEIRELLERALATGNDSMEDLLYNYALVLIQSGAPPAQIDAAVRAWRVAHPHSQRPDPRNALTASVPRRTSPRSRAACSSRPSRASRAGTRRRGTPPSGT
jgi:hypothetical protein